MGAVKDTPLQFRGIALKRAHIVGILLIVFLPS